LMIRLPLWESKPRKHSSCPGFCSQLVPNFSSRSKAFCEAAPHPGPNAVSHRRCPARSPITCTECVWRPLARAPGITRWLGGAPERSFPSPLSGNPTSHADGVVSPNRTSPEEIGPGAAVGYFCGFFSLSHAA